MAISVKAELNSGLAIEGGYFKITNLMVDGGRVHFYGALWVNEETKNQDKPPINPRYYSNSMQLQDKTGNLFEQAYDYITQLTKEYDKEKELFGSAEKC